MSFSFLTRRLAFLALVCSVVFVAACDDEAEPEEGALCSPPAPLTPDEGVSMCTSSPGDYQPRNNLGSWGEYACSINTDANLYSPINPSISTMARVEAFDEIAKILWNHSDVPSVADFTKARGDYSENEGLDSRVQRREDVHFPMLPDCQACRDPGMSELDPDRCAGPAKILLILNDAFEEGQKGNTPLVQARRIEAALLWFLYLSSLAEVQSCDNTPNNCDSAWAYYTGGTPRGEPKGLAAYVFNLNEETHHRAYDAALAVRCWRDLDQVTPAKNTELQRQALKQFDRALLHGVVLILKDRVAEWKGTVDAQQAEAQKAFVQTFFGLMEAEAFKRDVALVNELKGLLEASSASAAEINQRIDGLFPCT